MGGLRPGRGSSITWVQLAADRARNFLLFKTIGCQELRRAVARETMQNKQTAATSRCTFHRVNTAPEQAQMTTKNAINLRKQSDAVASGGSKGGRRDERTTEASCSRQVGPGTTS
jgi:hypothetical protein